MATKIVTKNSSTGGAVPSASDLVQGELAVNVADKRLFTEDNGGSIVELGTNPSTIDINAGSIDGTAIGASSASTGAFTTLTATGLTVDTDTLYVDSTNNRVGIGTTSPAESIHTAGNIRLGDSAPAELYSNSSELRFGVDKNNDNGTSNITFYVDNSEKMRIDSSGNVGIGTSSPSAKLELNVPTGDGLLINSADVGTIKMTLASGGQKNWGFATTNLAAGDFGLYQSNSNGGDPITAGTAKLYIDSSGNVGIGTSSPRSDANTTNLEVSSSTVARVLLDSTATNGRKYGFYSSASGVFGTYDYTANATRMAIDSSGNLLVGKTSTSSTARGSYIDAQGRMFNAQPNGASPITFQTTSNGTTIGSISVTASATSYNTSSDQRLKENIADADDAGSKIDAIQVRKYDWKADGSHQDYGMIAQELQAVAPEAVTVPADSEEMMGVDYSKLVPMLIKEIQSLRNRVAQLEE